MGVKWSWSSPLQRCVHTFTPVASCAYSPGSVGLDTWDLTLCHVTLDVSLSLTARPQL